MFSNVYREKVLFTNFKKGNIGYGRLHLWTLLLSYLAIDNFAVERHSMAIGFKKGIRYVCHSRPAYEFLWDIGKVIIQMSLLIISEILQTGRFEELKQYKTYWMFWNEKLCRSWKDMLNKADQGVRN